MFSRTLLLLLGAIGCVTAQYGSYEIRIGDPSWTDLHSAASK